MMAVIDRRVKESEYGSWRALEIHYYEGRNGYLRKKVKAYLHKTGKINDALALVGLRIDVVE